MSVCGKYGRLSLCSCRLQRQSAAIAFLSNISLDGHIARSEFVSRPPPVPAHPSVNTAIATTTASNTNPGIVVPSVTVQDTVVGDVAARGLTSAKCSSIDVASIPCANDSNRPDRRQTVSGDSYVSENGALSRRVRHNSVSLSTQLRHVANSSCDSLSVRSQRLTGSVCDSASSTTRLKRLRSDRNGAAGGGGAGAGGAGGAGARTRWLLVSRNRVPLAVHSLLTHWCGGRVGRSARREKIDSTGRRRVHSSGRHYQLPVISDRAELTLATTGHGLNTLADTLAVPPAVDDQEISYRDLLFPCQSPDTNSAGDCLASPLLTVTAATAAATATTATDVHHCLQHSPSQLPAPGGGGGGGGGRHDSLPAYQPCLLDNPESRSETHRTLLVLKAFRSSIIEHIKASELKRMSNDQFREKFPHIAVTLSKLRSLKRDIRRAALDCTLDMLTVAQAYCYLERLVATGHVDKVNRKLVCGACLLLSAKMNDVKGDILSQLIERVESVFRVHRPELLTHEFCTLVALGFSLHVPVDIIEAHLRLLPNE